MPGLPPPRRRAHLRVDSRPVPGDPGRPDSPPPVGSSFAGAVASGGGPVAASPPAADSLPPGLAENPDYEVLSELGRGGMGVVYLAQNTLMGRKEVLKVVSGPAGPPQRPGTVPPRDPQRGPAPPPQHRHRLLGDAGRRPDRPGHGIRRGRRPGQAGQGQGAAPRGPRLQLRLPGGAGAPARARARHGPPRHQAYQPHARPARGSGRSSRSSTSAWPRRRRRRRSMAG